MFSKWIERKYWDSPISRSEFEEFKERVLGLFKSVEKDSRATLASSIEQKQFKNAQCAFNKMMLEKMGIQGVDPANPNNVEFG